MLILNRRDGKSETPLSEFAAGTLIKIAENGTLVDFYVAKHDYESRPFRSGGEREKRNMEVPLPKKNIAQSKPKNQEVHIMLHNVNNWYRGGQSSLLTGELPKRGWFAW